MLDKSKDVYCNVFSIKCLPKERESFGLEVDSKLEALGLYSKGGVMIDYGGRDLMWITVLSNEKNKGKSILSFINDLNNRSLSKEEYSIVSDEFIHDPKFL